MEMELGDILAILDKMKQTELESFEYRDAQVRLKIRGKETMGDKICGDMRSKRIVSVPQEEIPSEEPEGTMIVSPIVGTFYAASSPEEAPFIKVGDKVKKGQTVGIVEAMKLMNEIEAECDGIVADIFVKNEQMVEYGQPLVRILED